MYNAKANGRNNLRFFTADMTEEVVERLALENSLHDELGRLSKQQSEALQKAIFLTFTREQAMEYDSRAKRIGEICRLLSEGNH